MLLTSGSLRVIHVTTHVSMRQACDKITKERVATVIRLADDAMKLMGIANPRIGVAGFNAHCSENGLFGDEEAKAIIPAVELTKKRRHRGRWPRSAGHGICQSHGGHVRCGRRHVS